MTGLADEDDFERIAQRNFEKVSKTVGKVRKYSSFIQNLLPKIHNRCILVNAREMSKHFGGYGTFRTNETVRWLVEL